MWHLQMPLERVFGTGFDQLVGDGLLKSDRQQAILVVVAEFLH